MKNSDKDLYNPHFVGGMFDRMSKTYGFANLITSFGFTARWRRQCVEDLPFNKKKFTGYDFMSGMGECWGELQKKVGHSGKIIAFDISEEMNRKASAHLNRLKNKNIEISRINVLENTLPSESADFIVSTFGVKTFNHQQQKKLAEEVARLLKPGGGFAMIEISEPQNFFLKTLYMFYLKIVIPLIGKVFLGNAEDYKMLGKYCANFRNMKYYYDCLAAQKLNAHYKNYFWGCASGVYGYKDFLFLD